MTKPKTKPGKAVSAPHVRTEEEIAYLQDFQARKSAKRELPKATIEITDTDDGKRGALIYSHVDPEIANALMLDAFGTTDEGFFDGLCKQLINTLKSENPAVAQQDFDFMVSVVAGIEPKDQVEAMLAAQMAAVHMQTMTFARRLSNVETLDQQNSAERAFNKLARTFTAQMEALNRHRGKGQQKMIVEHVHVYEGGQAIVGNVQGGGGKQKKEAQPHAKATDA